MLKVGLHIKEAHILEPIKELLSQAGICIKEAEQEWDCLLCTSPHLGGNVPSFDLLTFSQPFRFVDLLAIIESLPYSQPIVFRDFSLDFREKILTNLKTQQMQRLTEKECQILRFFHQNKGVELSKDRLLDKIWGYHPDTETHTLETHIYRLRQKIEKDPNNPRIILNGREGYFLD